MTHWMPLWEATVPAIAQTLLHFVWQGFALWLFALCVLHVIQAAGARVRYAMLCFLLTLLAVCPLVTFYMAFELPVLHASIDPSFERLHAERVATLVIPETSTAQTTWAPLAASLAAEIERSRVWLVAIWMAGSAAFAFRLALATLGIATIKRRRRALLPEYAPLVDRIAGRLAFRRRPMVYVVDDLSQAMALGLFKPLVLLPASWLCELPPDVLEMVIAHELAHLRRWDLAINLLQRVLECLLFFHPVVWWCSRRLRAQREICCDALAVRVTGDRAQYAKALTYLADQRIAGTEPLLVAGIGGPRMVLLERVRRVLGLNTQQRGKFYGSTCAAAGAAAASIVWLTGVAVYYASANTTRVDDPTRATYLTVTESRLPAEEADSRVTPSVSVPSEQNKMTLPSYVIEPPDILFIEATRVEPKQPRLIQPSDNLLVGLTGVSRGGWVYYGVNTFQYRVDASGWIDMGPIFRAKVKVEGLTKDEAANAIQEELTKYYQQPQVFVQGLIAPPMQPITGEHLVTPDGTVNLGTYGQVYVAGKTLDEAKTAIDAHLEKFLDKPKTSLSVFAYNSKVYYVVTEGAGLGDTVARFPITGNETVLDALSLVSGALSNFSTKKIWIARPTPGNVPETILPVDWKEITTGGFTGTNYQILPGDRVFVSEMNRQEKAATPGMNKFPAKFYIGQEY